MRIYKDGSIDHLGFHPAEFIEGAGEVDFGVEQAGEFKPPTHKQQEQEQAATEGGCTGCQQKKDAGFFRRMAKGVPGLLKSELGIGIADTATIMRRRHICEACPVYEFGVCDEAKGGCGCFLAAKVRVASESCPMEKW